MNIQERVLAALRGEEPDRVPVFIYLNPYVDSWYTNNRCYTELLEACKEYADVVYDWSFPTGFFCSAAQVPAESRELANGTTQHILHTPEGPITSLTAPNWRGGGKKKRWITEPADAVRVLSIPYVPPRPELTTFNSTRSRLGSWAVAQVTFPDPICAVGNMVDPETLAIWTLENRQLLIELLDTAFNRLQEAMRYCLEGGVGPIYYLNGPEYALPPLMSPKDFEEFVVPYDSRLVNLVHSYSDRYVIVHSHGRVNRFLERFAAMGIDGLNVLEPPPIGDTVLSEAKRRVGDSYCLIGNIQYDDVARKTEADVEYLVTEAIRQAGSGGGFILSLCAYPYERTLPRKTSKNLIHYLVKANEHGNYPLSL